MARLRKFWWLVRICALFQVLCASSGGGLARSLYPIVYSSVTVFFNLHDIWLIFESCAANLVAVLCADCSFVVCQSGSINRIFAPFWFSSSVGYTMELCQKLSYGWFVDCFQKFCGFDLGFYRLVFVHFQFIRSKLKKDLCCFTFGWIWSVIIWNNRATQPKKWNSCLSKKKDTREFTFFC